LNDNAFRFGPKLLSRHAFTNTAGGVIDTISITQELPNETAARLAYDKNMHINNRGFSLLEITVVIIIITIFGPRRHSCIKAGLF